MLVRLERWLELIASLGIYVVLTHLARLSAIARPYVHNIVPVVLNYAVVWHLAVWFPAVPLLWRLWHGTTLSWVGRLSRLVLAKAILQFVTVVPAPSADCRSAFWMVGCANMMFSGQVALTMLALHDSKHRTAVTVLQSVLVVVAGVHYISDCLVAVLAVAYVETLDISVPDTLPNGIARHIHRVGARARRTQEGVYHSVSGTQPPSVADAPEHDADALFHSPI